MIDKAKYCPECRQFVTEPCGHMADIDMIILLANAINSIEIRASYYPDGCPFCRDGELMAKTDCRFCTEVEDNDLE